jgi:hypothetical protein
MNGKNLYKIIGKSIKNKILNPPYEQEKNKPERTVRRRSFSLQGKNSFFPKKFFKKFQNTKNR